MATTGRFIVPTGTELVATLNDPVRTKLGARWRSRDAVGAFALVLCRRHHRCVPHPRRALGQVEGRAGMSFTFDGIRLRDDRDYAFAGSIESVRTANDDDARVDNEGRIQDEDQTERTVERTGVGAAIGAVIGAVAGGGKGAAIGAAVGSCAGAASVFVQGRDDLELANGTEFRIRARGRE